MQDGRAGEATSMVDVGMADLVCDRSPFAAESVSLRRVDMTIAPNGRTFFEGA
jgi:hypothetical protein